MIYTVNHNIITTSVINRCRSYNINRCCLSCPYRLCFRYIFCYLFILFKTFILYRFNGFFIYFLFFCIFFRIFIRKNLVIIVVIRFIIYCINIPSERSTHSLFICCILSHNFLLSQIKKRFRIFFYETVLFVILFYF